METLKNTILATIAVVAMISCQERPETRFNAITNFGNSDTILLEMDLQDAYTQGICIRVDKEALLRQLEITGQQERKELYFHKRLLNDTLPLSIGGGIGQSRLCMFFLRKAHIGEIQASIWPDDMRKTCIENNIPLI